MKKLLSVLLLLAMLLTTAFAEVLVDDDYAMTEDVEVAYGYDYSTPDEVALYLYAFCELPPNFITKAEARSAGWDSGGDLWDYAYGMSIGGDKFGNREGLLPKARGRQWYECDVNYYGGHRGAERIVFSSDGLICYSKDHYANFDTLYKSFYNTKAHYGQ